MPELPEVETIRLGLQKKILGLTIKKIEVLSPKSLTGDPQLASGRKVLKIWRKAKILGVELGSDSGDSLLHLRGGVQTEHQKLHLGGVCLLFHLKMTGQLILVQNAKFKNQNYNLKVKSEKRFIGGHPTPDMIGPLPNKSTRVIFHFSDGSKLFFSDQRRFGWIKVVGLGSSVMDQVIKNLGPEPLERGFTWQMLKQNLLRHKTMPVKVALMDQSVVSGIGNIYANEACFNAGLDPKTKVADMTDKQFRSLHRGVLKALRDGIKHGGSSRAHFVDPEGHKGYFLDYAYVYGKDKHPCKVCGTEIKKIQLAGRGTYFCPKCQK